jgi:IclR family transcriptional regulator, acetate operon repressor
MATTSERGPQAGGAALAVDAKRGKYSTPAVEKAFAVLELISRRERGLRMVDVVEALDLPKSSAFVLLNALEQLGYLSRDADGRYRLTLRMFELGMRAMRAMRDVDVARVAAPHLERLRDATGMTVHLARRDHGSVVYILKLDGPGFVRFDTYVGKRAALHLTGVGKALAAYLPPAELEDVARELDFSLGTAKSAKSVQAFKNNLKKIRACGYAVDDEEEVPGVRCVAAPIHNHLGAVIASVGVVGLASDIMGDALGRLAASVTETAEAISIQLGADEATDG